MNIVFLDVVLFHMYIQNITVYNLHISIPSDHYLVVEPGFRPSVFCCSYFESVSCHVPKGLKALWPEPCTWDDGLGRCTVDGVIIGVIMWTDVGSQEAWCISIWCFRLVSVQKVLLNKDSLSMSEGVWYLETVDLIWFSTQSCLGDGMAGLRPERRLFGSVRGPNCHSSQGPCMSLSLFRYRWNINLIQLGLRWGWCVIGNFLFD